MISSQCSQVSLFAQLTFVIVSLQFIGACCSRAGNLSVHSIFRKVSVKCHIFQRPNLAFFIRQHRYSIILVSTDLHASTTTTLTSIGFSSLNILKTYQALSRHFAQYPSDQARFPNFSPIVRPLLARGSPGPLEGNLHSAQYFHGRSA
jgi:hypothetical protein